MKQHIDKLTEEQAKQLLELAMIALVDAVYADYDANRMKSAEKLGMLRQRIESTAKSNK